MNELTQQQSSSEWEEAKRMVDRFEYGAEIKRNTLPQSMHKEGSKRHNVENYEVLFNDVLGFEFKGYFVFCKTCNSTRQKRLVLFNEPTGSAYVKDIVKDDQVTNE